MYLDHFGLTRFPFSIAPDPDFLYPTSGHQEALAHLHYAFTGMSGLVCLTGEVGTGKTTVCRAFMAAAPEHVRLAYLFNPQLSPLELLQSVCDELAVEYPSDASLKTLYQCLNEALLQMYSQGQKVICVIDEAQAMPAPLLEQIRLLTNLETSKEKLLTVILVGQPELNELLARHDLRQLSQRITARFHLRHLSAAEALSYVHHRTRQAGCEQALFDDAAIQALWRASAGVPRLLNTLADRALLAAYAAGSQKVSKAQAKMAAAEVLGAAQPASASQPNKRPAGRWLLVMVVLTVLALSSWLVTDTALRQSWQRLSLAEHWFSPAGPLQLLTRDLVESRQLPSEQQHCDQLAGTGWQCLWVEWPLAELQASASRVALQIQPHDADDSRWQRLQTFNPGQGRYLNQALIVWQPPAGYQQLIRPGQRSPVIAWVRDKLGMRWGEDWQVIGNAGSGADMANFYDPLLAREVADFQRRNGLQADKILGPRTLLKMQRMTDGGGQG